MAGNATPIHKTRNIDEQLTPTTKAALEHLINNSSADPAAVLESYLSSRVTDCSTAQTTFSAAKKQLRNITDGEPPELCPGDPIDEKAFGFHHPHYRDGRHQNIGQETNMTYNLQLSAMRTLSRAVRKVIDTILSVGDHDQITMTMREVIFHKLVQPFLSRVFGTFFLEEVHVEQVLLQGARAIREKIASYV